MPLDRTTRLRSMIDTTGRGLEIGPSYNPLLPKSEGFDVQTVDYTDQAGLVAKYDGNPHVDRARIERVDHVLDGSKTLADAIGRHGTFDYIVASHVIEHTPDMLGFLQSCDALLKPDGVLLLAVPDKRHCFDALQPLTSTGAVLQANLDGRTRPTPGAVFDDGAYNVVRDEAIGWTAQDAGALRYFASIEFAMMRFEACKASSEYVDVHIWRYVPSSFRLIVSDLHEIGLLRLREAAFGDSVGNEFYISLSANGAGCPIDRLSLGKQSLQEHAAIAV